MAESTQKDVYDLVYEAKRPEIFFKGMASRISAPGAAVTIRSDSTWDVPEPELTLVINAHGELTGFTIGNDMSSRSIEGENPLYLPQAKIWEGSAAVGPVVRIDDGTFDATDCDIRLRIDREGTSVFEGETSTSNIHRTFNDLMDYVQRGNQFPAGVFLMTGTGIVPPDDFTLLEGDTITISIDGIGELSNPVSRLITG